MDQRQSFEQSVSKGERFLARNNYLLAKRAFETALEINPDPELREKAEICSRELELQQRKEAIKRGRKFEKKKNYARALQCYQQAAELQQEEWLGGKIANLKKKAAAAQAAEAVRKAEGVDDPEARIAAYDRVLAHGPDPAALAGKADCLIQLGRHEDVADLFREYPPAGNRSRYLCGHASAKLGRFSEAMAHWSAIETSDPALQAQLAALAPFVYRDVRKSANGSDNVRAYRVFHPLAGAFPSIAPYVTYFKWKAVEELWALERYGEVPDLLEPAADALSAPLLGLYARVYFKLAERDVRFLEPAISFWLTAIHEDSLLRELAVHRSGATKIETGAIREALRERLERLIAGYERDGVLSPETRAFWNMERQTIGRIGQGLVDSRGVTPFPCTPGFAARFNLSGPILALLKGQRSAWDDDEELFMETCARFSSAGPSLVLAEAGDEEAALAGIPASVRDEVTDYCRQRIWWSLGIRRLKRGEEQAKKALLGALPLIQKYPKYADELIRLAFSEPDHPGLTGLAEVMELLSQHITRPEFLEATAYVMGAKVRSLLFNPRVPASVEKLLDRAARLDPESEMVKSAREEYAKRKRYDQMNAALKKQNLTRAARVARESGDPEMNAYFFETVDRWEQEAARWEEADRMVALRDFHAGCLALDPCHAVTRRIGREIEEVQGR